MSVRVKRDAENDVFWAFVPQKDAYSPVKNVTRVDGGGVDDVILRVVDGELWLCPYGPTTPWLRISPDEPNSWTLPAGSTGYDIQVVVEKTL